MRRARPFVVTLVFVCSGLSIFSAARAVLLAAQSTAVAQAERNGRVDADLLALERRLGTTEKKLDEIAPVLATVVSEFAEVKWIARSALGFVIVQVLISAFGLSARRRAADAGREREDVELA